MRRLKSHGRYGYSPITRRPDFHWPDPPERNVVDKHVFAKLRALRMKPAQLAEDGIFLRRIYLDVLGVLLLSRWSLGLPRLYAFAAAFAAGVLFNGLHTGAANGYLPQAYGVALLTALTAALGGTAALGALTWLRRRFIFTSLKPSRRPVSNSKKCVWRSCVSLCAAVSDCISR